MKFVYNLIINFIFLNFGISQTSCILGDVYVSEAANAGDDYIEVYNGGSEECTLEGFKLDDSEELEDFTFSNVILSAGAYWIGYEDSTDSFNSGLGGGVEGDSIVFADADRSMLITILEQSLETLDGIELSQSFGSNGQGCYTFPTPGESNVDCYEFIIGCTDINATNYDPGANADDGSCEYSTISCILGEVYVSEAANRGDPDDYIEVYNNGNEECTLAGFHLDDSVELEDFTFGYIILAPGDFWIGYENSMDSFNSGLGSDGDIVVFADSGGNMLTIILEESIATEDGVELSQSYGSDGTGCYTLPTPGESNTDCVEISCLLGDLNGDGGWNVLDIVTLANCVVADSCADLANGCAGDLNGDGGWNVLDIVTLANCVLADNCGGRVDDASDTSLIKNDNKLSFETNGFIGGVQMALTHNSNVTIEMIGRALFADYLTTGNETRLLVISPETENLFSYEGEFEITEVIVANSEYEVSVNMPIATTFTLSAAYPNPFNPTTTMMLTMPASDEIRVDVYNLLGQFVAILTS